MNDFSDAPSLRESPTFTPEQVSAARRSLTPTQRMYVLDKCIHGDCTMATVRALDRKGLFHLMIDSPNGLAGFMRLTPLGEAVRAAMLGNRKDGSSLQNPKA